MNILHRDNHRIKLFNITIYKQKVVNGLLRFYLFGVPICSRRDPWFQLINKFRSNKNLYVKNYDQEIKKIALAYTVDSCSINKKRIAYLATQLYDFGGHTKCLINLATALLGEYEQQLFLMSLERSNKLASKSMSILRSMIKISKCNFDYIGYRRSLAYFIDNIIKYEPCALIVFTHPDDVFSAGILSIIKAHTNIKILYFNHASHLPCIGMTFADLILEGTLTTEKITHEKRKFMNTKVVGLQSVRKEDNVIYAKSELEELKNKLRINNFKYITLSGATASKFFKQETSQYFELIKKILRKEKDLVHVILSNFNENQLSIIDKIFDGYDECRRRLILLNFQNDYLKYFQMADVFVDSFPMSSALTYIDLMRCRTVPVIKINHQNPELTFHEYFYSEYKYKYGTVDDMEKGIFELLYNVDLRAKVSEKNYNFWLKTYESKVVRQKYIDLIENCYENN